MNTLYLKFLVKMQDLMSREDGQDLVEYALLVTLLSLGALGASRALGTAISNQFTAIGNAIA